MAAYRGAGTTHSDNVVSANDCTPGTVSVPPTTPPTTRPTTAPPAGTSWAPNVSYPTGQVVTYGGARYQCRQAHTSLPGWEPPNVLALWLPV